MKCIRKPITDDTLSDVQATARLLMNNDPQIDINAALVAAAVMKLIDVAESTNDILQERRPGLSNYYANM